MTSVADEHFSRAEDLLSSARLLTEQGHAADSVSRSYYAMFHASKAVLAIQGVERKSHRAVHAAFSEFAVRAGLVSQEHHSRFCQAYSDRADSDYLSAPELTREDALTTLRHAEEFLAACREAARRLT